MDENKNPAGMEDDSKEYESTWKSSIVFGLICIGLVWLCTKLPIRILSVSLILILLIGVAVSAQAVKDAWKAEQRAEALLSCIGFALHIAAAVLYVIDIFQGLLIKI